MKIELSKKASQDYVKGVFALFLIFCLVSMVTILAFSSDDKTFLLTIKSIGYSFLHHFWTALIIGLVFYPFYFLLNKSTRKLGASFFVIIGVLILIVQISLVKYSQTTLLNLGADLLGYSFDDMYLTVSSSVSFSLISFIPFLLVPLLFIGLRLFLVKKLSNPFLYKTILVLGMILVLTKVFVADFGKADYQNKLAYLVSDIVQAKMSNYENSNYNVGGAGEFPLIRPASNNKDVLGSFFNIKAEKPNIVIVMLEGMGAEFLDGNSYSGFSPYLDDLISKSLYWENFLSTTGRTFGVIPSLLGSLPLGQNGFLELPTLPTHLSLLSVLKENGYTTSYYTGSQSSFDKANNFLEYNGVNFIEDENTFGSDYKKTQVNAEGFSWGYPDSELFRKMLSGLNEKTAPRLDVLLTLSNHEPFSYPQKEVFLERVDSLLNSNKTFKVSKNSILDNKEIFASLLYVDTSIENFMKAYQKRPDYQNTIFIFTGDHRLIPIAQKDELCRFHVPLIIYSPLLKKAERFKSVSSHLDVTPSLLAFLTANYDVNPINNIAFLGTGLDTTKSFRNTHELGLMRYKGVIKDFIYKDYFLSNDQLYRLNPDFSITKVKDELIFKEASEAFQKYKQINSYVTSQNKIYPISEDIHQTVTKVEFSEEELKELEQLTKGLTTNQVFELARTKAFNSDRKTARLLCDFILNEISIHVDARTLKGRTLAWDAKYSEAEVEFLKGIKQYPFYDDPYLAILDLYWWSNQDEKGVEIGQKALKNKIKNPELGFKMAKAYNRLNNQKAAVKLMDSLLKIYPKNIEYMTFKKTLK